MPIDTLESFIKSLFICDLQIAPLKTSYFDSTSTRVILSRLTNVKSLCDNCCDNILMIINIISYFIFGIIILFFH